MSSPLDRRSDVIGRKTFSRGVGRIPRPVPPGGASCHNTELEAVIPVACLVLRFAQFECQSQGLATPGTPATSTGQLDVDNHPGKSDPMTHPLIVAHRSLTPGATENAQSAIAMAAQSGADLIELDIRLTLDRQPVVLHDAFLHRSTGGRGWVRLWPSFALTRIPLRGANPGDRVSSLRAILQDFPRDVQPALHLKDRAALPAVLRHVSRYGRPGRTWLWLEHPRDVYTATRALPELRVTLLRPAGWMPGSRQSYFEEAQWVGAAGVSVPWGVIDERLVHHAHRHRLLVFSRLERLATLATRLDAGLDGVVTGDPRSVWQQLRDRDLAVDVPES